MAQFNSFFLTQRTVWSPPDPVRDRPILGAFVGERGALIVETGASPTHASQFRNALKELGVPTPRYAALTHWHWDHVFGSAEWRLPTLAHVETRRRMVEMAHLDWRDNALNSRVAAGLEIEFIAMHVKAEMTNAERAVLVISAPEITFTEKIEVDLGGLTVQVFHIGGDHSPDCSVIYSPEEQVAFVGDCFYGGFIKNRCFYTTRRLFALLDTLEKLQAHHYILAHDPAPLTRAHFLRDANILRRTGELVERARERESVLAQLPALLGQPLNEEHAENVDNFLLGLTMVG